MPKAHFGIGLRLPKQQLESRARGDGDPVVCCRPDTDHLLTKEQTTEDFRTLVLIRSSADGVACLISSLCRLSGFCFIGCANAPFVFFIRRFSVCDLKCAIHLKMQSVFETAASLSGIVLFSIRSV